MAAADGREDRQAAMAGGGGGSDQPAPSAPAAVAAAAAAAGAGAASSSVILETQSIPEINLESSRDSNRSDEGGSLGTTGLAGLLRHESLAPTNSSGATVAFGPMSWGVPEPASTTSPHNGAVAGSGGGAAAGRSGSLSGAARPSAGVPGEAGGARNGSLSSMLGGMGGRNRTAAAAGKIVQRSGTAGEGTNPYNDTTVDVVTVPCPGADPFRTWSHDPAVVEDSFGIETLQEDAGVHNIGRRLAQASLVSAAPVAAAPMLRRASTKSAASSDAWVPHGIRSEAKMARVLWYQHGEPAEGATMKRMAEELLEELVKEREARARRENDKAEKDVHLQRGDKRDANTPRPLFFVCHSIGGIVVKLALTIAARDQRYRCIRRDCYGVTFFGTPHRGSSYLSSRNFAPSIQRLLGLSRPLPKSITDQLRLGHKPLLQIHENFRQVAHDMKIWSFYETIDSQLSGRDISGPTSVNFMAPITSIKSAILDVRDEAIYPLISDHANCASFVKKNAETKHLYLRELSHAIAKAEAVNRAGVEEPPWNLDQLVKVEVHGFYEDRGASVAGGADPIIRAWTIKLPLADFRDKGPDRCLEERLREVGAGPRSTQFLGERHRATSLVMWDSMSDHGSSHNMMHLPGAAGGGLNLFPPPSLFGAPPASKPAAAKHQPLIFESPLPSPNLLVTDPFNKSSAPDMPLPRQLERVAIAGRRGSASQSALRPEDAAKPRPRLPSMPRSTSDGVVGMAAASDAPPPIPGGFVAGLQVPSRPSLGSSRRHSEAAPASDDDEFDVGPTDRSTRRGSETALMQDMQVVSFGRPDPDARRFVWIHVPFNNPAWVKAVFETIKVKEGRDFGDILGTDHWGGRHTRGRHSQPHASFVKPGVGYIPPRSLSPSVGSLTSAGGKFGASGGGAMLSYVFLPYLHFDSYLNLIRRRDLIRRRMDQGRSRPVPDDLDRLHSLELQAVWEYLGHDPPLNCRRTLDQFGYPSLRDTRGRDDDQMLYKMTKERVFLDDLGEEEEDLYHFGDGGRTPTGRSLLGGKGGRVNSARHHAGEKDGRHEEDGSGDERDEDEEEADDEDGGSDDEWAERREKKAKKVEDDILDGKVLMVDQLWMWTVDDSTVVTFFPRRECEPTEGPLYQQADLRDSIFNEVNADLTRRCENALDHAALAVLHAVTVLIDRNSHPDLEIFRIFEEAISILTEKMTSSLKHFRTQGFRDKAHAYDELESKPRSIRARHKRDGEIAERWNRDNTSAMLELRDIEDELSTLLQLFEQQTKVVEALRAVYARPEVEDMGSSRPNGGVAFLDEALARLAEYKYQATEMVARVRSTRDDFDKLLQMVQRQAQVDEVRLSRLQADLASAQSRSIMIFTTFTVIFLPLTFFTGLFGMNVREWDGPDSDFIPLPEIGAISLPTSAFLILGALVVAWSTRVRRLFRFASRRAKRYGRRATAAALRVYRSLRPAPSRRRLAREQRRREARELRREQKRQQREPSAVDFWEVYMHQHQHQHLHAHPSHHHLTAASTSGFGGGGGGGGAGGVGPGAGAGQGVSAAAAGDAATRRESGYTIPPMNRKSVNRRRALAKQRLDRKRTLEKERRSTWADNKAGVVG